MFEEVRARARVYNEGLGLGLGFLVKVLGLGLVLGANRLISEKTTKVNRIIRMTSSILHIYLFLQLLLPALKSSSASSCIIL